VTYDPATLYRYADRVYARAAFVVVLYGLLGSLVGFAAYGLIPDQQFANIPLSPTALLVLCTLLGAAIGWERSLMMRVQAQRILCAVKTEEAVRQLAERATREVKSD
jgi:predicted membrane-bound spermidine synthase